MHKTNHNSCLHYLRLVLNCYCALDVFPRRSFHVVEFDFEIVRIYEGNSAIALIGRSKGSNREPRPFAIPGSDYGEFEGSYRL